VKILLRNDHESHIRHTFAHQRQRIQYIGQPLPRPRVPDVENLSQCAVGASNWMEKIFVAEPLPDDD